MAWVGGVHGWLVACLLAWLVGYGHVELSGEGGFLSSFSSSSVSFGVGCGGFRWRFVKTVANQSCAFSEGFRASLMLCSSAARLSFRSLVAVWSSSQPSREAGWLRLVALRPEVVVVQMLELAAIADQLQKRTWLQGL